MNSSLKGKHTINNAASVDQDLRLNSLQQVSGPQNSNKKDQDVNLSNSSSTAFHQNNKEDSNKISSKKLTTCLLCLAASLSCLSPYLSLHATQRVGLLLFESDLIQLRSSLISVTICGLALVILYAIQALLSRSQESGINNQRSLIFQKILKRFIGFFAIISAISYLSLAVIVPQIRQLQRMPTATFDCNANLITIENCHQQFSSNGPEQTLKEAVEVLLVNDLGANPERLINKFSCLKYNDKESGKLQVPTRFLLHHCDLVCKPQRQQLHQFGDDLNQDQTWHSQIPTSKPAQENLPSHTRMIPPYHHETPGISNSVEDVNRHYTYYNSSDTNGEQQTEFAERNRQQVSLKICFSGELTGGGGSNYKQYCITNLAHPDYSKDRALTVAQLNAMLRRQVLPTSTEASSNSNEITSDETSQQELLSSAYSNAALVADQSTNYVNPIVQFESHFKNWPHLQETDATALFNTKGQSTLSNGVGELNDLFQEYQNTWCKFKPIPPLIVNNKPFNDIQCSLEHEYTMTTGPSVEATSFKSNKERIYLKKSKNEQESSDPGERCNIHCKVNILYQIHVGNDIEGTADSSERKSKKFAGETARGTVSERVNLQHYYLPLKPCLIISGSSGDKSTTANYYLLFRSLGDSTLLLVFILLDIFLLLESIGTKQSPLESKKHRLGGLLLTITLMPLVVSLIFDLITFWSPFTAANRARKEQPSSQLITFLVESIQSSLSTLFTYSSSINSKKAHRSSDSRYNLTTQMTGTERTRFTSTTATTLTLIDNYLVPFFTNAILMFLIAINSMGLPLLSPATPLLRVSSIEKLGMSPHTSTTTTLKRKKKSVDRQATSVDELNSALPSIKQPSTKRTRKNKKQTMRIFSFIAIALFMGTQFNLSQIIQTQILFESFYKSSSSLIEVEGRPSIELKASWFILATHSVPSLLIFCLVLLFMEETSAFFSRLSVFKMSIIYNMDNIEDSIVKSRVRFLKHLSVATFTYSLRYLLLAIIQPNSRFKWILVFVVQLAEFINFPIIWLAISTRLHELLLLIRHQQLQEPRDANSIICHLIGRSLLSFGYFVLCRFIALFAHSLHTSIHLHSDNVDWFVTSFYVIPEHHETGAGKEKSSQRVEMPSTDSDTSKQYLLASNNSSSFSSLKTPDSLFSPLPSERQTYLHASRLFLRYNSLVCLLIGMIPLSMLLYFKYQMWVHQKRTSKMRGLSRDSTEPRDRSTDSCIDEQLSFDLMQIHANTVNTRTIPPRVVNQKRGLSNRKKQHGPRANILFHYNLNQHRNDSSDLSSSCDEDNARLDELNRKSKSREELRIPIALEEEDESSLAGQDQVDDVARHNSNQEDEYSYLEAEPPEAFRMPEPQQGSDFVERTSRSYYKKIRIIEEGEEKEEDQFESGKKKEESSIGSRKDFPTTREKELKEYANDIKACIKRISFAPSATLIEDSATISSLGSSQNQQQIKPKRASPEPSIGNESDFGIDEEQNQYACSDSEE